LSVEESIHILCAYSLAKCRGSAFSVHPAVHSWVQERCSEEQRKRLTRQALEFIARIARLSPGFSSTCHIRPHLVAVFNNIENYLVTSPESRPNLSAPAHQELTRPLHVNIHCEYYGEWFYWLWGKFTDICHYARITFSPSIESGSEEWRLLYTIGQDMKHGPFCFEAYHWAIALVDGSLPRKHPAVLTIVRDLAWEYYSRGQYEESLALYEWTRREECRVLSISDFASNRTL
jgi:hypothetical protein